jgi:signal transduction histidine kinase
LTVNNESIEVAKDLAVANEKIKQQALKQKEFIDIAAHELRTPTQLILGYTEMIMSDPKTNIEYIKVIAQKCKSHSETRIQHFGCVTNR